MGIRGESSALSYSWVFPICPHRVSIDLSVIGALQHDLTGAPEPRFGLLYGRAVLGATRIDGRKPLVAFGPEPMLEGLESARREVVGFYSIREGSAFILTPDEMHVAKDLFCKLGSVVLLIERRATGPAEGTFFFWRGETFVHNLPSPFPIDPALLTQSEIAPPGRQIPRLPAIPVKIERRTLGLVAAGIAAGMVLSAALVWKPVAPHDPVAAVASPAESALPSVPHPDLEITWDPQATVTAKAGLLKIDDGGVTRQMAMDSDQLRLGRVLYSPTTSRVEFALKAMRTDGHIVEVPTSAHEPPAAPPVTPELVPPDKPEKPDPKPSTGQADRRPPPKHFSLVRENLEAPTAPAILDAPPVSAPIVNSSLPLAPALPKIVPPTLPAPVPASTTAHASSSGRLIWTGTLLRKGVVEVDGRSASLGALTGALPGVPVAVTVEPAEFSDDGLVVYTTDASRNNRMEPASARNGWNKIHYVWDPERVRQIAVLESPNPSNRFSRLALRSDARRCSMIVIDWVAR
jgi:hypothetical protein